ncbi:hypothetical protein BDV12DRAFT_182350 [Aspergillus spectabilis]
MEQARPPVRSIISCTFCRQKKLRCDRLRPCSSCVKRGLDCAYLSPAPPSRNPPTRSTKQLNQRIRELEKLVNVLGGSAKSPRQEHEVDQQPGIIDNVITSSLGKLQVGETSTSYVSGSHWAALQHSIAEIKECLDADDSHSQTPNDDGPALLLGLCPLGEKEDFLALVPAKPVADRLVSRFFSSMEPGYNQFWVQPQDVTLTWLSMLFSMLCLAIHLHQRTIGEPPDPIGDPKAACNAFRLNAAYCLIKDRYTTPSKYSIEALLTYAQCEYFRSAETRHENWVLLGVILRLAFHVGLHRDGSRYQGISCFEAEMRRRTWAFMAQGDVLSSFQSGLPRMLQKRLVDTRLPRNLLDEDFNENSQTLPPPRPDSDATPISYVIAKSGISDVFGLITDHVASTQPNKYEFVLQLDNQLNKAYATVPSHLQFRDVSQSVTDLPHIIMRRYSLEILYQKSRCILHRQHLSEGRSDPRFAKSRQICIEAAMKLLHHQATLDAQVQPGGVLCHSRWFMSSLASHDFILAAMIVCLEVHHQLQISGPSDEDTYSKDQFLSALNISRQIWGRYKALSTEAKQAWQSTSIMLNKLNAAPLNVKAGTATSYDASNVTGFSADTSLQFNAPDTTDPLNQYTFAPPNDAGFGNAAVPGLDLPSDLIMDNNFWDFSNNINWVEFDATMQNQDLMGNRAIISPV